MSLLNGWCSKTDRLLPKVWLQEGALIPVLSFLKLRYLAVHIEPKCRVEHHQEQHGPDNTALMACTQHKTLPSSLVFFIFIDYLALAPLRAEFIIILWFERTVELKPAAIQRLWNAQVVPHTQRKGVCVCMCGTGPHFYCDYFNRCVNDRRNKA